MKVDDKFRRTAKEVVETLEAGGKIEVGEFEDYDSTVKVAVIINELDGMDYDRACSLLERCKYVIKATTIQADKIPV